MSRNLEIETKGFLTKEEYELILSHFKDEKPYVQTNYYIDTDKFKVRLLGCGLRVREKEGKFELTLKVKEGDGKLEINQDITKSEFESILNKTSFPDGEVKDYLINMLGVNTSKLFVFASMETTRLDIPFNSSLISVDKSICLGETDYELECESADLETATKDITKFLKKFGLKYKKFSATKLRRAIERYQKAQ